MTAAARIPIPVGRINDAFFTPEVIERIRRLQTDGATVRAPVSSNDKLFFDGGDFLSKEIKPGSHPYIESLREASVAGDFDKLFEIRPPEQWKKGKVHIPVGKFRFEWVNGKPKYVQWTKPHWRNYFLSKGVLKHPDYKGTCPEPRLTQYVDYWQAKTLRNARKVGPDSPHHLRRHYPLATGTYACKPKQKSVWVKIRKPVAIAAAVVAAVYLGPKVVSALKGGGATGGAATSGAAGTAGQATGVASGTLGPGGISAGMATQGTTAATVAKTGASAFSTFKTTANTVLGYVNKARTIKAVAEGELPPPPIGVSGASFREWVFDVAKHEIQEEAKEAAMQAGVDYVQRKMTAKEEAALRAEIAQMQRELEKVVPANLPPEPAQALSPELKKMQQVEIAKKNQTDKLVKDALMIGVPLLLLAKGVG